MVLSDMSDPDPQCLKDICEFSLASTAGVVQQFNSQHYRQECCVPSGVRVILDVCSDTVFCCNPMKQVF